MSSHPHVSAPSRRSTAALAALSTLATLIVAANGFASPVHAAASASAAAHHQKPNVRVTHVTATSSPTASGTMVETTVKLKNVTSTRKSKRTTRLSLTNAAGTFRLGQAVVHPVAAKGRTTVRVANTVKLEVPAGQYAVRACRGPVDEETCRTSAATVTVAPASLVAAPVALTFGDVRLGSAPARRDVTFTNNGRSSTGALSVVVSGSSAFTITTSTCASSLIPGASCTVSLAFAPETPGTASGALNVSGASAAAKTVALSGSGLGAPVLAISRSAFEFGDTLVGASSAPGQLIVTNTGNIASGVPTVALTPASTNDYEVTANTCTTALTPGATCTVDITFTPATPGDAGATVDISAAPGGSVTTALTGTGLAPADLTLAPGALAFGNELVNNTTDTQTVTLTNSGDVTSGVPSITLSGVEANQFTILNNGCTTAIAAGASCDIDVAFAPTASGAASASLTAAADPGGTTSVSLAGTGQDPSKLTISESAYDFGYANSPAEHTFTITNDGDAGTGTPAVNVTGDPAFTVTTNTCTTALAGGGTCTVGVTYTGSGLTQQSADLSVSSTPGGEVTADLTGFPVALTIAPSSREFGGVLVGSSSAEQSFTLTNHALTPALVDGEGADGPFVIDDSCFTVTIPARGTCTFTGHFKPTASGPINGFFEYFSNSASARTDVSGVGLTPAALSVDPTNIQFGAYAPSTTGNQVLTVTNTGTQPSAAQPSITITGADAAEFNVQGTTCSGPLAGGASCTFTLQFAPLTLADQKAATATINGPGSPSVSLAGISAPLGVSMVPAVYDFGTHPTGSSTTHTFRVVNTTESGAEINSVSSGAPFNLDIPADFTCVLQIDDIQPHNWCTISIAFRPTGNGFFSRSLVAAGDGFSATATMNGTGGASFAARGADTLTAPSLQPMATSVRLVNGEPEVRSD